MARFAPGGFGGWLSGTLVVLIMCIVFTIYCCCWCCGLCTDLIKAICSRDPDSDELEPKLSKDRTLTRFVPESETSTTFIEKYKTTQFNV